MGIPFLYLRDQPVRLYNQDNKKYPDGSLELPFTT